MEKLNIRFAKIKDSKVILGFIKKLADYEKLSHEVKATEQNLEKTLFSPNSNAESILGFYNNEPVAFALFFHNYSTFLAQKGLYLEDLFVLPEFRGKGFGKQMLKFLAKIALERDCGRFEWSVLDWNEPAINFYKSIGAEIKNEWLLTRITGDKLYKLSQ
ncbi:MAG: GNAT family N-acetyltransferase [Ignavibacteriales bacterium]|nr:GNAT family N-acetyltransferase [Ignavibacteriales bacterium]MCB9219574.1 GNAT family N-acetyltransferase [Ignavibacteriales bacterium]